MNLQPKVRAYRQEAKFPSSISCLSGLPPEGATLKVGLPALNNVIKKLPYRDTQDFVF